MELLKSRRAPAEHPQIRFTELKEIFFLNNLFRESSPWFKSNDLAWYLKHFQTVSAGKWHSLWKNFRRYKRYLPVKAIGEGTASTAIETDTRVIDAVREVNPKLKIILMVRNPVKRAWSHCKKDLLNLSYRNETVRSIEDVPMAEIEEFLDQPYLAACSDYEAILAKWTSKFPAENIFIGYFDDVVDKPAELVSNLHRFLGVASGPLFRPSSITKKIEETD